MQTKHLFLLPAFAFFACAGLQAQVVIGSVADEPANGALLDLNSPTGNKGGLLLSNVTIADLDLIPIGNPDIFPGITPATAGVNIALRGAMVYNDGQNPAVAAGIYIWNGYYWTKDGRFSPAEIPVGTGTLKGQACFDVAKSNDDVRSGKIDARKLITTGAAKPVDFSEAGTNTYTFTPSGSVNNLCFYAEEEDPAYGGKIVESLTYNTNLETQTGISGAQTVGVVYKNNLNDIAVGKYNTEALKVNIYAVYSITQNGLEMEKAVKLTANIQDCQCCGAFTLDGQWLNFMCHNLGADETLDPFTFVTGNTDGTGGTLGYLYQWGRKSDGHQFRNSGTSTSRPDLASYNSSPSNVFYCYNGDWITDGNTDAAKYRWGSSTDNNTPATPKSPNDPCPAGWKVPSLSQWNSILPPANTVSGSSGSGKIGDALYLPGVGYRNRTDASISAVGSNGYYWSSTWASTNNAYRIVISSGDQSIYSEALAIGMAVRCVSE